MAIKKGLGKGLDSMIPGPIVTKKTEKENNVSRETLININQIEPNKSQPRKTLMKMLCKNLQIL